MHLVRAESPGPQVGKIASKMKVTTRILYLIYLGLTVLEIIILMFDKPIAGYEDDKLFLSILATFGCAGTGGFGFIPNSMELFNPFSQYVMATFLLLFGINFGLYYLILIGKIKSVLKSEELKTFFTIVFCAVGLIFISLAFKFENFSMDYTTEEAFRHSYFQVASIITTTGYSTTDFNCWPTLARTLLVIIMIFGGMAGSTAGGLKTSRLVISIKGIYINIRQLINPRYVPKVKFEGKTLDEKTTNGVFSFISLYALILVAVTLILSFDPINGDMIKIASDAGEYEVRHGFLTNFTASLSCISNIGPGLDAIGPYSSFAMYSFFSKIILTLTMLLGRLEILPILILFSPKTWQKG
jgi:trk system potassium uptake protein TrkH